MTVSSSISVVVVNFRTPYYAIDCVRSLVQERSDIPDLEVVLIDNASGDGSVEIFKAELADLIEDRFVELMPLEINGGFGWANNQAILKLMEREVPPQYIMLLNPDCTIERAAAAILRDELAANPGCAIVGSQLFNPDGSWTGSAFRFPTVGREFLRGARLSFLGRIMRISPTLITSEISCEAEWVTGASCMIRTRALREVGLFDEGFFLYFEEVDLMYRLRRAGWSIRYAPASHVFHIGGAATGLREGKALTTPSFPLYWFQSRRRFFTLAYGPFKAWLAGISWILGTLIGRLVGFILPTRADPSAMAEMNKMVEHGLRPNSSDRTAAKIVVGDRQGLAPHWMKWQEKDDNAA